MDVSMRYSAGVLGLYPDFAGGTMSLTHIDPLGDKVAGPSLTEFWPTNFITDHQDLRSHVGAAIANPGTFFVYQFDRSGAMSTIVAVEEYEWPDEDSPYFISGIAAHPEGHFYMAAADRLIQVNADGTWAPTEQWACAEEDESHEFCAKHIAIDPRTGEVALFDYFGGFAYWSPETGLDIRVPSDMENQTHAFMDAETKEGGGYYALGGYLNEEGNEAIGIFKWDDTAGEYALKGTWTNDSYVPQSFAIEGESGDFYISANGGWESRIFRMTADGEYMASLYNTGQVSPDEVFMGVAITWDQD